MPALDSPDHLIRRKAAFALKATGAGDFSWRIGVVQTRNTTADYERAISRIGNTVQAVVSTTKEDSRFSCSGRSTVEGRHSCSTGKTRLFQRDRGPSGSARLRDPRRRSTRRRQRGPVIEFVARSIRCLSNVARWGWHSGKDTGGSQWFVTHAPQPHLDGGYTVFGNVVAGMNVVDTIVRGDVIRSIYD